MDARLKTENPEEIVFTMTITATAKEWEELRDQLSQKYPSWKLSGMIDNLLSQARKVFWFDMDLK
jgi:hypothetical protein